MRKIEWTSAFKRDFKREKKKCQNLEAQLFPVLSALKIDQILEPKCCDHALVGIWKEYRDCHIRPDLVLIYQKPDEETLRLVRIGSHAELSL